jgi:hypothetical protein
MIYTRYIYSFFENKRIVKNIDELIEFILIRLLYSYISTYKYNDILSRTLLKNIFINNKEWMELLNFLPDLDDYPNNDIKSYIHKNLDKNIIEFYKYYHISLTSHCIHDIKDIISMIVIYFMVKNTSNDKKFNKYTKLMLSDNLHEIFINFRKIK